MNQYAIIDRLGYYFIGYGENHFPEYSKDSSQAQLYLSEGSAEYIAQNLGPSFRVVLLD